MFSGKQYLAILLATIVLSCIAPLGYTLIHGDEISPQSLGKTPPSATAVPSITPKSSYTIDTGGIQTPPPAFTSTSAPRQTSATIVGTPASTAAPLRAVSPAVPPAVTLAVQPVNPPIPAHQGQPAAPFAFAGTNPPGTTVRTPFLYSFSNPPVALATDVCGAGSLNPSGGVPPYHFAIDRAGGNLPVGLALAANGLLTGTPEIPGVYHFRIIAEDQAGHRVPRDVTMTIRNTLAGTWSGFYRVTEDVRGRCVNMDTHTFGGNLFLNLADHDGVISGTGSIGEIHYLHVDENGIGTSVDLGTLQVTVSGVAQNGMVDLVLDPGAGGRYNLVIGLSGPFAINTMNGRISLSGTDVGITTMLRQD